MSIVPASATASPPARATLRDPYLEWAGRQGVPIIEDFCIDIRKIPVAPWAGW